MKHCWLSLAVLLSGSAHAGWFGPSNYNECVLENMKGVNSDVAAVAVARACLAKFPPPPPPPPTAEEIAKKKQEEQREEASREVWRRELQFQLDQERKKQDEINECKAHYSDYQFNGRWAEVSRCNKVLGF